MTTTTTMKPTKKAPRLQNRKDHYHGATSTDGVTIVPFSGTTLENVKAAIDKSLGSPNMYRPDPSNEDVLFVYNSKLASSLYGEKGANLPIGWVDKVQIPANVGNTEVANALITDQSLTGADPMDDIDDLFCESCSG